MSRWVACESASGAPVPTAFARADLLKQLAETMADETALRTVSHTCRLAILLVMAGCSSEDPAAGPADAGGADPKSDGGEGGLQAVDTIPPGIVEKSPTNGDENVSVRAPITVTFSEPVKVGDSGVSLVGAGSTLLSSAPLLSTDGLTLIIKPTSGITAPAALAATLAGITDLAGNPLPDPGLWSWVSPLWLKLGEPRHLPENISPLELSIAEVSGTVYVASDLRDLDASTRTSATHRRSCT